MLVSFFASSSSRSRWALALAVWAWLATLVFAAAEARKEFAIPAGTADRTLKQFALQAGVEVVYPAEVVRGVKTPEVKGHLTPGEAVGLLLSGTGLSSAQDARTGALSISRQNDPNGSRAAQKTQSDRPANHSNPQSRENPKKP